MGRKISIHNNTGNRKSWYQRSHDSFNAGPALEHYRCFLFIDVKKNSIIIANTVEFLHSYITQTTLLHEYKLTHAINMLTCALEDALAITNKVQQEAIDDVGQIFEHF